MKGDYLRYILEKIKDERRFKNYSTQACNAYNFAIEAGKQLDWKNELN